MLAERFALFETIAESRTISQKGYGGESGIRTFPRPLESVSYRFYDAAVAVDATGAVAPCTPLHAGSAFLKALDVAARLEDLQIPAGNRLELLKGDQAGRHSIRIDDQYRITFRWEQGHAYKVRVKDYH